MRNPFPGDDGGMLTSFAQQQIVLQSRQYGYVGTYVRDSFRAESDEMIGRQVGQDAVRLTLRVLTGKTVSEKPEVYVNYPASGWQHAKYTAYEWYKKSVRPKWKPLRGTPSPFSIFLFPLIVLFPRLMKRKPVQWKKLTAKIEFQQDTLFPEIDMPPQAGMPVIFEDIRASYFGESPFGHGLSYEPSRFMDEHEIANEILRSNTSSMVNPFNGEGIAYAMEMLTWLKQHGVNTDQLVKRDARSRGTH